MSRVGLHFALLLAPALFALGQGPSKPEVAPDGRYQAGDFQVDAVGACRYDERSIDCWDMKGVRQDDLTAQVRRVFDSSNGLDLALKIGKKNRLLVLSSSGGSASYSVELAGGEYGQTYSASGQGPRHLQMIRSATDFDTKTAGVIFNHFNAVISALYLLTFRRGEKGSFQGIDFEVGATQALETPKPRKGFGVEYGQSYGLPQWGNHWSVVLGANPISDASRLTINPVGADGKPILYVDAKGNPASAIDFLNSVPKRNAGGYVPTPSSQKFAPAMFVVGSPSVTGAYVYQTNVNPSKIKALQITTSQQRRVLFEGFPLDPKG